MCQDPILLLHQEFSAILYHLHKHGDAILNALMHFKHKRAVKCDPIRTVFKTIHETCDYAPDGLICEVKHQLEGLLFFQARGRAELEGSAILQQVYYERSAWLDSYHDPPPEIIFDKEPSLSEPDVAYLCNYCRIYKFKISFILNKIEEIATHEPLFATRHAHKALLKVMHEQERVIEKLMKLLSEHMNIE